MRVLLVAYLGLVAAITIIGHVKLTPDLFLVFASVVAVMFGLSRAFIRDWVPFIVIFLAWEAMRGVANRAGAPVHSDDIIAIERFISFGVIPSEELQRLFPRDGQVSFIDWFTTVVYIAHFALPLLVAFGFWLRSRLIFYRYVTALMAMSFAQFGIALALPVAPPRFAFMYGHGLAVADIATAVGNQIGESATWLYLNMIGNPVAAFPSLHAAYPVLAFLFLRERWKRASWLMMVYAALVWFSIVYLGHHYVVDAIGGVLLAVVSYVVVNRIWHRRIERNGATSEHQTIVEPVPE